MLQPFLQGEAMSLKFFDVDVSYTKYLREFDSRVPDIEYSNNNKFLCGIILKEKGINYYAPISSFNQQQRTNIVIKDKGRNIASIRFSFMFPVPESCIKIKDFSVLDSKYRNLLDAELRFCKTKEREILRKASQVYKWAMNKDNPISKTCCDFALLEEKYWEYINITANKEVAVTTE